MLHPAKINSFLLIIFSLVTIGLQASEGDPDIARRRAETRERRRAAAEQWREERPKAMNQVRELLRSANETSKKQYDSSTYNGCFSAAITAGTAAAKSANLIRKYDLLLEGEDSRRYWALQQRTAQSHECMGAPRYSKNSLGMPVPGPGGVTGLRRNFRRQPSRKVF